MSGIIAAFVVTVAGKPQTKERPRLGKDGHVYTPTTTKRYERLVAATFKLKAGQPAAAHRRRRCEVDVLCWFPNHHRRDVDNVLKCILDGLKGAAYMDDSQVVKASITNAGVDRDEPRAVIEVRYVTD